MSLTLFTRFITVTTTMWSDFQRDYLTRLFELVFPCERQSLALVLDLLGSDKTHPCMPRVYYSEEPQRHLRLTWCCILPSFFTRQGRRS